MTTWQAGFPSGSGSAVRSRYQTEPVMGPAWERTSQMAVLIPARPQSSGGAQIWLFRAPKANAELVRTLSSYSAGS